MKNRTEWSRGDRLAVAGLLIAGITCVAALVIVPEFRHLVGLERTAEVESANAPANRSTPNEQQPAPSISIDNPDVELGKVWLGSNNKGETPRPDNDRSLLSDEGYSRDSEVQLVDMALFNRAVYLKLSICNVSGFSAQLGQLYVWYTSPGQDSVNWHFTKKKEEKEEPLLQLKSHECQIVGGWSDQVTESFRLRRPLGKIYYSGYEGGQSGPLDLEQAERDGFARVR